MEKRKLETKHKPSKHSKHLQFDSYSKEELQSTMPYKKKRKLSKTYETISSVEVKKSPHMALYNNIPGKKSDMFRKKSQDLSKKSDSKASIKQKMETFMTETHSSQENTDPDSDDTGGNSDVNLEEILKSNVHPGKGESKNFKLVDPADEIESSDSDVDNLDDDEREEVESSDDTRTDAVEEVDEYVCFFCPINCLSNCMQLMTLSTTNIYYM